MRQNRHCRVNVEIKAPVYVIFLKIAYILNNVLRAPVFNHPRHVCSARLVQIIPLELIRFVFLNQLGVSDEFIGKQPRVLKLGIVHFDKIGLFRRRFVVIIKEKSLLHRKIVVNPVVNHNKFCPFLADGFQ